MERALCVPAFAKLNLTLDVLGKRADGYHEMDMVMQSVSLFDEVYITISDTPGIKVDINRDDLPKDLHNIAGKAARAFLDYVNLSDVGVKVYIIKNIPDKAGLAGGSSDAAAVIRGMDALLGTGLTAGELYGICEKVGSDVPFCLYGGTARSGGRGEILSDLPPMPDCGIVIVKPEFSVSTPELFAALDGCEVTGRPDTVEMIRALERGDLTAVCAAFGNVFTGALPEAQSGTVEAVKRDLLAAGALGAEMTGTGSAVFGVFETERLAETAVKDINFKSFAVKPLKKIV